MYNICVKKDYGGKIFSSEAANCVKIACQDESGGVGFNCLARGMKELIRRR